ncbi:MAG: SDR family NAD(P)-dependent oxidoreductase [Roseitalea sp.]|jgi:NAD(P)-dependent dehydrogenase (short-subunit alcohol dehydrogenase family)|nr:SDR family NAD(P)-dependent oxidoreductase [Roseitalea sp.]MBO6723120.1 SDR family NAD(P)-dependent oxidoreductase [Roseitalea sp.]MBO6742442.1 SDR family NAD(P)-dependent oxidoreductase [Roseitalea sp.]
MKTVLITGANRGLGLEVAHQLGAKGFHVLAGIRNAEAGRRAEALLRGAGIRADYVPLDMAAPDMIAAAADMIAGMAGGLDVLINNAAVHYDTHQRVGAPDFAIVEEALAINTVGAWRMTVAALPHLLRSEAPRIVNVSSESGAWSSMTGTTPAYSLSKIGLNALTRMMASEFRGDGILVNAVCPGWTATDMGGGGRPVPEGARGIVWAATLPDDGPTGGFFRDGKPIDW